MLPKQNRLTRGEVDFLLKHARDKWNSDPWYVRWILRKRPIGCWTVVVPKALMKNATDRNRTRRRIYAALEKLVVDKEVLGYDAFLYVKKDIQKMTPTEIEGNLRQCIQRILR